MLPDNPYLAFNRILGPKSYLQYLPS
jgi:hypothetical protein